MVHRGEGDWHSVRLTTRDRSVSEQDYILGFICVKVENSLSISDLRRLAKRRLPRVLFEAIESGVEDELCIVRNEQAFFPTDFCPGAGGHRASQSESFALHAICQGRPTCASRRRVLPQATWRSNDGELLVRVRQQVRWRCGWRSPENSVRPSPVRTPGPPDLDHAEVRNTQLFKVRSSFQNSNVPRRPGVEPRIMSEITALSETRKVHP